MIKNLTKSDDRSIKIKTANIRKIGVNSNGDYTVDHGDGDYTLISTARVIIIYKDVHIFTL